jgi:hypothetical protein
LKVKRSIGGERAVEEDAAVEGGEEAVDHVPRQPPPEEEVARARPRVAGGEAVVDAERGGEEAEREQARLVGRRDVAGGDRVQEERGVLHGVADERRLGDPPRPGEDDVRGGEEVAQVERAEVEIAAQHRVGGEEHLEALVQGVAARDPRSHPTADAILPLEEHDLVPTPLELERAHQPRDPAADDDRALPSHVLLPCRRRPSTAPPILDGT